MTNFETMKTNDFLRRRKLRIQQVREQSKEIAKRIRQRASKLKLHQVEELDEIKKKEYFKTQEQLVKHLQVLYSKGVQNIGTGHRKASEIFSKDETVNKVDLSKIRAKAAATQLQEQKQAKLDERKKLLDRKLQAREAANQISREKSTIVASKLRIQETGNDRMEQNKIDNIEIKNDKNVEKPETVLIDISVQCNPDEIDLDHKPEIPSLPLKNIDLTPKKDIQSEKSKKPDLFALSAEMPSSLRGGLESVHNEHIPVKPSLTIVSEYLQNRGLRLREFDKAVSTRQSEELQGIKQTLIRTRASRTEGNTCQVIDGDFLPVPSWHAETNCELCSHDLTQHKYYPHRRQLQSQDISKIHNPSMLKLSNYMGFNTAEPEFKPCPVLRSTSPFTRRKLYSETIKKDNVQSAKPTKESENKKSSISLYDHATKQIKSVPFEENVVTQEHHTKDDAYIQALKESTEISAEDEDHQKKLREMRSKIAMTKQHVEKEYKDTMTFLNSLPKGQKNVTKNPYMVERREENRQKKMQEEFRAIERECKRQKSPSEPVQRRSKSKSPYRSDIQDDFQSKDFEYSWMPVPESDGRLTVHTIPNTVQQKKSGNSVKFSKVDSYHEYRSRHKHTPPTKEYEEVTENTDNSSLSSESSVENIKIEIKDKNGNHKKLSNSVKRSIYKIIKDNTEEKEDIKENYDLINEIIKCLNDNKKEQLKSHDKKIECETSTGDGASLEKLDEGVYKTVNDEQEDNVKSMFFSEQKRHGHNMRPCRCKTKQQKGANHVSQSGDSGDTEIPSQSSPKSCVRCKCGCSGPAKTAPRNTSPPAQPSAATSTNSYMTKTNKSNDALPNGGFIKLIDEGGHEAGKFYIGATGFLRDDAYEVLIQLRKNNDKKELKPEDAAAKKDVPKNSTEVESVQNLIFNNDEIEAATRESKELLVPVNTPDTDCFKSASVTNLIEREDKAIETEAKTNIMSMGIQANVAVNKGVTTQFKLPFNIASDADFNEKSSKMISAATQTTFNGSIRPGLNNMSSSTSTAYMSPPEIILPTYLRRDLSMSCDETNDQCSDMEEDVYNEFLDCKSHRYKRNMAHPSKKLVDRVFHEQQKLATPITVRTCSGHDHESHKRRVSKCPRGFHHLKDSQVSATSSAEKQCSIFLTDQTKRNNSNLNPVLKDYVNKLLSLNKEGLKAIEVINQDCSSISTPGSSIINDPRNLKDGKVVEPKISLEQIKEKLAQQIADDYKKYKKTKSIKTHKTETTTKKGSTYVKPRGNKRKSIHKVNSLIQKPSVQATTSSTSSIKENYIEKEVPRKMSKCRSISSPTPRTGYVELKHRYIINITDKTEGNKTRQEHHRHDPENNARTYLMTSSRATTTHENINSNNDIDLPHKIEKNAKLQKQQKNVGECETGCPTVDNTEIMQAPIMTERTKNKLTNSAKVLENDAQQSRDQHKYNQDNENVARQDNEDKEIQYRTEAENKIQNMEKIAELTEKCTTRLSSLAKVLEEVRKSKSSVYSPISSSESTSDSDNKSNKLFSKFSQDMREDKDPEVIKPQETAEQNKENVNLTSKSDNDSNFIPLLSGITKNPNHLTDKTTRLYQSTIVESLSNRSRGRPPPALSRVHLKDEQELVTPHELSTVLEVDSPLSLTIKNDSKTNQTRQSTDVDVASNLGHIATDLQQRNSSKPSEISLVGNNSAHKIQMPMDINQFNDIMLKPFISIKEYAKQCNVDPIFDEESNMEDFQREEKKDNNLSSSPSNGSLPDVISELLKRNLISEPFKFETVSNVQSSSISSESTLSLLALKTRKDIKKPHVYLLDKENIADSSDTLSVSSNPDLEKAFTKLGMGWASSTLRKTKERLALSSSTNTSSSSLSQFKIKRVMDIAPLNTECVSSPVEISKIPLQTKNIIDDSKNAEQQTSITNSMMVKEFLKNELAKKITFTNKSTRNDSEEFISMYDYTKIPEQMKVSLVEECVDSPNENNNRARTSTPVQLYKSITYRSSSSSSNSKALFSNADELSSVKGTSNSFRNSTSEKDDLTIPNCSLKVRRGISDHTSSKSE